MSIPELLKPHFEQSVAIFGNGVSGKAVATLLTYLEVDYVMYDKMGDCEICLDFTDVCSYKHSLVIYSPGFALDHKWLQRAKKRGYLCLSELDFGGLFWKGKIIAVTGTNGKSTLTQFLADALVNLGFCAIPCGNIGSPLTGQYSYFDNPEAIAVCEVSSFQAETICYFNPDVLLWTNFDEDHLDRHSTLKEYFDAKWTLVRALKSNKLFIGESVQKFAKDYLYSFPCKPVVVHEKDVISLEVCPEGLFNQAPQAENYLLALAYWSSQDYDYNVLKKTALSFKSLPYRLERIANIKGATFWNDSKGTNFLATIAALKRFNHQILWIGGGKSKGGDLVAFVSKISPFIQEAFLIGQTAVALAKVFNLHNISATIYQSLEDAVQAAFERVLLSEEQDIVFSPGFSSYDMFTNAEERGIFFEKKVLELKSG